MKKTIIACCVLLGLSRAYSPAWEPKTEMLMSPIGYPKGKRISGKAKERREAKRRRRAKGRK